MTAIKILMFSLLAMMKLNCSYHLHKSPHTRSYHLINLLKSRNNFFKELNQDTQKAMNKLFETLHVSKHFSRETKIKTLLTMYQDLIDIAEKNFELYDVLKNVSDVDFGNKPINQVRLNELMIRVLNETEPNGNTETDVDYLLNIESTPRSDSFSSEFANSHEFRTFIGGFIGKIKRLNVDDFFEKKDTGIFSDSEVSGRRDNQVWDPPANVTDAYKKGTKGKTASISSYPFVVSVHIHGEFSCTGSIISADRVITAASCLKIPEKTHVRHSSDYTLQAGELIPVQAVFLYPEFDANTLRHNIAILRVHLERNLSTRSIELDRSNINVPYNAQITIVGWVGKNAKEADKLTSVDLAVYHIDECKEKYSSIYVTENNFCAGLRSRESSICSGGVGSPGSIHDNLLYGIVSFGAPKCGDANDPTVFTKVGMYTDWIDYIMKLPAKQEMESNVGSRDGAPVYYNKPFKLVTI